VRNTAKHFENAELAADKAYLGCRNTETVEAFGGTPCIMFKNTVEPKDKSIWAKMYHSFMYNREALMWHYHKRSNAESAFSMMKGKFGDAVRSKSEVGQVNEVLANCLCHNVCVLIRAARELGVETTFGSGSGVEPKLFL
jgi:transposase